MKTNTLILLNIALSFPLCCAQAPPPKMVDLLTLSDDRNGKANPADSAEIAMDQRVGEPVDIASSAYQYRADRKAGENPPESWLALMHFAKQPLNKPADVNTPAIKQVLCGLLWEEIRPVQKLVLSWASDVRRRPAPEDLAITTLDHQGSASSWWNNLLATQKPVKPVLSNDGKTYLYDLPIAT